jgi:hypothetical protein
VIIQRCYKDWTAIGKDWMETGKDWSEMGENVIAKRMQKCKNAEENRTPINDF